MNHAHEMLKQQAESWAALAKMQNFADAHPTFHQWLLENGEECGPVVKVKGQHMKRIKECYMNSMTAITRSEVDTDEWFYTEGVVLVDDLPILIDHAWLTNRKGEVLDLTLRSQDKATYFGIPFKPNYAVGEAVRWGYYGLFGNGATYNTKVVFRPVSNMKRAWPRRGDIEMKEAA
jgi:hypothetical protein